MTKSFTLEGYRELLSAFVSKAYQSTFFDNVKSSSRHLLLRHDLDMSIEAAIPLAEIENQLGMSATYFVLLRTELYNPHSDRGRSTLIELQRMGHRIGLHFDAALYRDDAENLNEMANWECNTLEQLIGCEIDVVSFHRPAKDLIGKETPIAGRLHTYQPKFIDAIGYCSDSRGGWHYGHPLDHAAVERGTALQLLTHPIWWTGEGEGPQKRLDEFADNHNQYFREELARNCTVYTAPYRGTKA